ncbi:MAG: thioredoxin domain-containing protein [Armatimonadota bacterium]
MTNDRSSDIQWMQWGAEAFKRAEEEDKLILLDIGAAWCHWCHVMDRTTYSDPTVINIVNERFIPVRVEADKRPDIQDRYLLGGWPTTVFLLHDGRIMTGTTFVPPEAMVNKLRETDALYHDHKALVTMHVTSMAAEAEADRIDVETTVTGPEENIITGIVQAVKRDFDANYGGFGKEPKFPYPDAIRFAFLQYRMTGDKELLNIALKTLDAMFGIYDLVWGGFYRYSVTESWDKPHYEKMLYVQAGVMDNYLEAYQVTGDDKYGEIAAGIKTYVERFLCDKENGGFYGSQDADVGSHDPDIPLVTGEEYFPKDDAGRMAIGIPYVDKTVYTDWNGQMASAYLRLYHVMGDVHAKEFALKTIDQLLQKNVRDDCAYHYADDEPQLPGLLADQAYLAVALIDAYQTTGDRRYLIYAEKIAAFITTNMQDVVEGGFYFQIDDPHAIGELSERHKPFDENVVAARMFADLYHLTGYKSFKETAERTLHAINYPQITDTLIGAGYGIVADLLMRNPVHIAIVGSRDNEQTQEMLTASLHAYEPTKLVQVLDPDQGPLVVGDQVYEAQETPMAYICVQNQCMPPVTDAADLEVVLADILGATPSG